MPLKPNSLISTSAMFRIGGLGLLGYVATKPATGLFNSVANNVARGYEPTDTGVFGIDDIVSKFSSPFVSRYEAENAYGESTNKSIYTHDLDGWTTSMSSIMGGYTMQSSPIARGASALSLTPHVAGASVDLIQTAMGFEAMRKSYYFAQSLVSGRMTGIDIGKTIGVGKYTINPRLRTKSHLEMRVLGGMKYNTESVTGKVLGVSDRLVSSTWNMIKSGFKEGSFRPSEEGSFIRENFLYEGKKGFDAEVAKLASFESMKDIGFRDKFIFGKTFNRIDNLGLSADHASELKRSIVRKAYTKGPSNSQATGSPRNDGIKTIAKQAKMSKRSKNYILDGLAEGKERILKDKEGARSALDSDIVKKRLSMGSMGRIAEEGSKSIERRRRLLRIGKGVGILAIAAPLAAELAIATTRKAADTVHSLAMAYDKYSHTNFGYDNYQLNEASKSDRQQAVEAIQNASLNARYLLGNEASMYH